MEFRDTLPAECPPVDAKSITGKLYVYRALDADVPCDADFFSQVKRFPAKKYRDKDKCIVSGLSVFTKVEQGAMAVRLPSPRLKGKTVCKVELSPGSGKILQNGQNYHCTWWPSAGFDILANCTLMT